LYKINNNKGGQCLQGPKPYIFSRIHVFASYNDVWFFLTPNYLQEGSCHICVCLRIVVSNTPWLNEQHGGCLISVMNCLPFGNTWVLPGFWWYPRCSSFLVFCVVFLLVVVLCLAYTMLPVSLDCPYLTAPSVFSNV
jgi:hypothetical protein